MSGLAHYSCKKSIICCTTAESNTGDRWLPPGTAMILLPADSRNVTSAVAETPHDGIRGAVHVEHSSQDGAGEALRVAVVRRGSHDPQADELAVAVRLNRKRLRIDRVRKVMQYAGERAIHEGRRHVQASRDECVPIRGVRAVSRQVAGGEERTVRVSDHRHPFSPRLEVRDGAPQDLDADVDLGLQVGERQLAMARRQIVVEGQGLVHLDELYLPEDRVAAEVEVRILQQRMRRTTLLEDPHRVGVGVAEHPEQLGDIGRQRRRLVGRRGDHPATPEHKRSSQNQRGKPRVPHPALAGL